MAKNVKTREMLADEGKRDAARRELAQTRELLRAEDRIAKEGVIRTQEGVVQDILDGFGVESLCKKYGVPQLIGEVLYEMGSYVVRQQEFMQLVMNIRDSDYLNKAMFCNMVRGIMSDDVVEQLKWQNHYARVFPLEYRQDMRKKMAHMQVRGRQSEGVVGTVHPGMPGMGSRVFEVQAELEGFEKRRKAEREEAEKQVEIDIE